MLNERQILKYIGPFEELLYNEAQLLHTIRYNLASVCMRKACLTVKHTTRNRYLQIFEFLLYVCLRHLYLFMHMYYENFLLIIKHVLY